MLLTVKEDIKHQKKEQLMIQLKMEMLMKKTAQQRVYFQH
jgi:hypothetical protein